MICFPTKRPLDARDSAVISYSFLRLSSFPVGLRPSAGAADRYSEDAWILPASPPSNPATVQLAPPQQPPKPKKKDSQPPNSPSTTSSTSSRSSTTRANCRSISRCNVGDPIRSVTSFARTKKSSSARRSLSSNRCG